MLLGLAGTTGSRAPQSSIASRKRSGFDEPTLADSNGTRLAPRGDHNEVRIRVQNQVPSGEYSQSSKKKALILIFAVMLDIIVRKLWPHKYTFRKRTSVKETGLIDRVGSVD